METTWPADSNGLPILTDEFGRWLEASLAPAATSTDRRPDPRAPEVVRFGEAVASRAQGGRPANKVFCFGHDDLHHLDEILKFYAEERLEPYFYLSPARFTTDVGAALADRGFYQSEFSQAILYGLPLRSAEGFPPGVTIERVTSENLEEYVLAKADGFEWHEGWRDDAMDGVRRGFRAEEYCFLARCEGSPAGVATLGKRNALANLGDGAVIPQFRKRGCHLALIYYRLHLAYQLGCTLVKGAAFIDSPSFRNQQRAGLRLAYIESGWSRR
jgi:hypothetical protein